MFDRGRAVHSALLWGHRDVVSCQVAAKFIPVLGFYLFPEVAFQALTASYVRPVVDGVLAPYRAALKFHDQAQQDRNHQAISHDAILTRNCYSAGSLQSSNLACREFAANLLSVTTQTHDSREGV